MGRNQRPSLARCNFCRFSFLAQSGWVVALLVLVGFGAVPSQAGNSHRATSNYRVAGNKTDQATTPEAAWDEDAAWSFGMWVSNGLQPTANLIANRPDGSSTPTDGPRAQSYGSVFELVDATSRPQPQVVQALTNQDAVNFTNSGAKFDGSGELSSSQREEGRSAIFELRRSEANWEYDFIYLFGNAGGEENSSSAKPANAARTADSASRWMVASSDGAFQDFNSTELPKRE